MSFPSKSLLLQQYNRYLCVLEPAASDGAPQLAHEGLEVPEALQHGLVLQEPHVLNVVVRLVLN